MKVLIIEDELTAGKRLIKMVREYDPSVELAGPLGTIVEAVNYLSTEHPDVVLLDVQLSDGLCFEIFEHIRVDVPIIFITAFDNYMIDAFKVNSVDYLLKPVHQDDLNNSLEKYKRYHSKTSMMQVMFKELQLNKPNYRNRFLVKSGRSFFSIEIGQIAYFVYRNKLSYLVTFDDKKYVIDQPLEQLEQLLDPIRFHRINRNMIISSKSIERIDSYFNNRLLLQLNPVTSDDTIVSRNYLKSFKTWVDS